MHGQDLHQGAEAASWIWLVSGIGEGPALAAALLEQGWWVQVSVVGTSAARAYAPHPRLRLQVGALLSDAAVAEQLRQLQPRWLVDATHPFATAISPRLERVCRALQQPLLQLEREEELEQKGAAADPLQPLLLPELAALGQLDLRGQRLLLAIGSRQLPAAIAASPGALHHARVLDQAASLQLALAAGLGDGQVACLRPSQAAGGTASGLLEQALCRHWQIDAVLCRQSGGRTEAIWRRVCSSLQLRLLLLQRPAAGSAERLPAAALLEKLGAPDGSAPA